MITLLQTNDIRCVNMQLPQQGTPLPISLCGHAQLPCHPARVGNHSLLFYMLSLNLHSHKEHFRVSAASSACLSWDCRAFLTFTAFLASNFKILEFDRTITPGQWDVWHLCAWPFLFGRGLSWGMYVGNAGTNSHLDGANSQKNKTHSALECCWWIYWN